MRDRQPRRGILTPAKTQPQNAKPKDLSGPKKGKTPRRATSAQKAKKAKKPQQGRRPMRPYQSQRRGLSTKSLHQTHDRRRPPRLSKRRKVKQVIKTRWISSSSRASLERPFTTMGALGDTWTLIKPNERLVAITSGLTIIQPAACLSSRDRDLFV